MMHFNYKADNDLFWNLPFLEEEIIDIIHNNDLADRQILIILSFLTKKWGCKIVTKNIAKKLIARKSLLDSFFTRQTLDGTSDNCFKNKNGTLLTRTVVYCHDVPGFIAYKMLLENITDW